MGATEEFLAEAKASLQARHAMRTVAVWPEHWHALQLFLAMHTQWLRVHQHRVGLNYAVLPVVRQAVRVARPYHQRWSRVFAQLQIMEAAALEAFNQQG